jgi:cbb3-type cytochrome c oxidase subunit III
VRLGTMVSPLLLLGATLFLFGQDRIPRDEAKKLKSPIPYTKKSIAEGRNMFIRYCTGCHGQDGKATIDIMGAATDLTDPKVWKNGTSEGEIFRSIRDGAGDTMPSFKPQVPQEKDIWHLVNYIHSLWPDDMRPPLQESK